MDQTAFHELYKRYAPDVYRFALWLSGNPIEADDIASETFVRAWTGSSKIRTETVKAYLFIVLCCLLQRPNRFMIGQVGSLYPYWI